MLGKKEDLTINSLLREIEDFNKGTENIKATLKKFISSDLPSATGMIIIWSDSRDVNIESCDFNQVEATWALSTALFKLHNKGLTLK